MMVTRTLVFTKPTKMSKLDLMHIFSPPCAKPVLVQDLSHVALFPLAAEGSLSNFHSRVSFSFPSMIIIPGCSCTGIQDQAHHSYECQLHTRLCPAYRELKGKHHSKTGIKSTDLIFVIFSPQLYFLGSIFLHVTRKFWQHLPKFS